MAETLKDILLEKLGALKKDKDVILFRRLERGCYVGITAKDFAEMLNWIRKGKVVEEAVVGYAEDGSPVVQRKERYPTVEEVKQRWLESGYVELFEEWLSKGIVKPEDLKALFGSEKPWL
jgi:hypothetical protein